MTPRELKAIKKASLDGAAKGVKKALKGAKIVPRTSGPKTPEARAKAKIRKEESKAKKAAKAAEKKAKKAAKKVTPKKPRAKKAKEAPPRDTDGVNLKVPGGVVDR